MIKTLLEMIIRHRNPTFTFDSNISVSNIIELTFYKVLSNMRSYKLLLRGKVPNKVFLDKSVRFEALGNIKLGKWIQIGSHSLLSSHGRNSHLIIGNNVTIGAFSRIIVTSSFSSLGKHIIIGNNVGLGDYTHIGGCGGVKIGKDTIIGSYVSFHPSNHNFSDSKQLIRLQGRTCKGIVIGENCWIGAKVTVLDGVKIGSGCIIAAGSVVTKNFDENSFIAGVPAIKKKNVYTFEKKVRSSDIHV